MPELADIRAELAANLAPLNDPGLEVLDDEFLAVQVSAYPLSNPTPPVIMVVGLEDVAYGLGFGRGAGPVDFFLIVDAYVGDPTGGESPNRILDRMLIGADSVQKLIESDTTMGGSVGSFKVLDQTGNKVFNLPGNIKFLGATWRVKVVLTDS